MTFGYGIDAIDAARENQSASNAAVNRSECPARAGFLGTEDTREDWNARKKNRCCWLRSGVSRIVVNEPLMDEINHFATFPRPW
jgi:hypothetical protein